MKPGTLTFFCGKMGAGKSTYARALSSDGKTVLLSEDDWLSTLYPQQIHNFDDYRRHAARMKPLLHTLVTAILTTGTSVVMDFPANTRSQRKWFVELAESCGADHRLIYLQASDARCLQQIAARRIEQPERANFDTEAVFHQVTGFFEEPDPAEGLQIQLVDSTP